LDAPPTRATTTEDGRVDDFAKRTAVDVFVPSISGWAASINRALA
jgi:hypothetical protein